MGCDAKSGDNAAEASSLDIERQNVKCCNNIPVQWGEGHPGDCLTDNCHIDDPLRDENIHYDERAGCRCRRNER